MRLFQENLSDASSRDVESPQPGKYVPDVDGCGPGIIDLLKRAFQPRVDLTLRSEFEGGERGGISGCYTYRWCTADTKRFDPLANVAVILRSQEFFF